MNNVITSRRFSHSRTRFATNSGPLSLRMVLLSACDVAFLKPLGHAFQIRADESRGGVAVAKVMELDRSGMQCVAKVASIRPDHPSKPLKRLAAVATRPVHNPFPKDSRLLFGRKSLIVSDFLTLAWIVAHYHEERPHQGKENEVLIRGTNKPSKRQEASVPIGDIACRQRLGGLLKHYSLKAA